MNPELIAELQSQFDEGRFREGIALAEKVPANRLTDSPDTARFLIVFGKHLREMTLYQRAVEALERAVRIVENDPSQNRVRGDAINETARCHDEQRRPAKAESLYRQALELRQSFGTDDLDYAHTCFDYGSLLTLESRAAEGKPLFETALAIYSSRLGNEHPFTASCSYRLADLDAIARNEPPLAIDAAQRLLDVRSRELGKAHPLYGYALVNLGAAFGMANRFDEQLQCFDDAEPILVARLGQRHPAIADVLIERMRTSLSKGDPVSALSQLQRARSIYEQSEAGQPPILVSLDLSEAIVHHHRSVADGVRQSCQKALARLAPETDLPFSVAQGLAEVARLLPPQDLPLAEEMTRFATRIATDRLPEGHFERYRIDGERAIILSMMNRPSEAMATLRRLKDGVNSARHTLAESLTLRHQVGSLHEMLGEHAEAVQVTRKALSESRERLGEKHPHTLDLDALHRSLLTRDPTGEEMLTYLTDEQRQAERDHGTQSDQTIQAILRLAREQRQLGRVEGAEKDYRRALTLTKRVRGDDHSDTADLLAEMGEFFHDTGNLEAAERHYHLAFNLSDKLHGEQHARSARFLFLLGTAFHDAGNFPQAENFYRRATESARELPDAPIELAQSLVGLGKVRQIQQDPAGAESCFAEGVELFRAHRPAFDLQRMHAEQSQALFWRTANRWEDASSALRTVVERMAITPTIPLFVRVQAQKHLADTLEMLGDLTEARRLLEEMLALLQERLPMAPEYCWPSREALARVRETLGEPDEAKKLLEKALAEMSESVSRYPQGNGSLLLSDVQTRLGDLHFRMGQYERADSLYLRSLELRQAALGRFHLVVADSYLARARLRAWSDDSTEVERLETEAIAIGEACTGARSPYVARLKLEIATERLRSGKLEEGRRDLEKLRSTLSRDLGEDSPELVPLLMRLAEIDMTQEKDEDAERLMSEAARLLPENPGPAFALGLYPVLGKCRLRLDDLDGAEEAFRSLLEYLKTFSGANSYHMTHAWRGLTETTIRRGETDEALAAFTRLAELHDTVLDYLTFDPSHESLRIVAADGVEEDLQRLLTFVGRSASDDPDAIRLAAGFAARCKHFRIDGSARDRLGRLARKHPTHAADLLHLRDVRRQVALRTVKGAGTEGIPYHETLVREWQARANEIESKLADAIPELQAIRSGIVASVDGVFDRLPRDTGFVDFVHAMPGWFTRSLGKGADWFVPHYFAFAYFPSTQEVSMIDLGPEKEVEPKIRKAFESPDDREWYDLAWRPILEKLNGVKRLIVSPDGEMVHYHPGTICTPDGNWLLDQYEIRSIGAARDLEAAPRPKTRPPGATVLAAPAYGPVPGQVAPSDGFFGRLKRIFAAPEATPDAKVSEWPSQRPTIRELAREGLAYPPLAESREEAAEVAKLHRGTLLDNQHATVAALFADHTVGCLHLNSYTFSRLDFRKTAPKESPPKPMRVWENPLDSYGFALAGANRMLTRSLTESDLERGIGLATLCEIQELDWSGVDLCSLSLEASPGRDEIAARYGLIAIERVVRAAGVRAILFNPSPVPLTSRRKVIACFHRHYLNSKTATEAYRKMAVELRKTEPAWRAFVCYEA